MTKSFMESADFVGMIYGRLVVIQDLGMGETKSGRRTHLVKCQCACGETKVLQLPNLKRGVTKSCGCYRRERVSSHGMINKSEYRIWALMKDRCLNKNTPCYSRYGGRGITVCKEWENSFEQFYRDMGDRPSKDHSLDRIDNYGGYSPENCRWATRIEQGNNKRNNVFISFNGETNTIAEWARIKNINKGTLWSRIKRSKMSPEKALSI